MDKTKDKVESTKEFEDAIQVQSSDSLKAKLVYLYKNQSLRDEILGKGYNEDFYSLEHGYNLEYVQIFRQIRDIINTGNPIPFYWRTAIINSKFFPVNKKDKEVLAHLTNIDAKLNLDDKKSFMLIFEFSQNPYFNHPFLEKTYTFDRKEDSFKASNMTQICWNTDAPNKKKVIKKVKKGKTNTKITKEKKVESFFNIFEHKEEPNEEEDESEEESDEVSSEADFFMEDLLPYSLEHYLDFQKFSHEHHDGCCSDDHEEDDEDKPHKRKK